MKIAIIGRGEKLLNIAKILVRKHYNIGLVITAKESPEYKANELDYKNFAKRINAKYYSTPKILTPEILEHFKDNIYDLGVSINYSGIIPQKIIDNFKIGILNAHGGDLPRYRGNACQAWAIINGENKIGLCVHKMVGGELDNGDIIAREYLDIDINSKIIEYHKWSEKVLPDMMFNSIEKLSKDNKYYLEKQSKNPKDALRCYPRTPNDSRINWHDSNEDILRLINASSEPYSGAFTLYKNNKVIIWDAVLHNDDEIYCAIPGQIANPYHEDGIIVITGKGKLLIKEVTFNNERDNPKSFIKSIRTRFE